jgi:hypothetical protein
MVVCPVATGSGMHCARKLMNDIGLPSAGTRRCQSGVSPPALAPGCDKKPLQKPFGFCAAPSAPLSPASCATAMATSA